MMNFTAFAVVSRDPEDISKDYLLAVHNNREGAEVGVQNARTIWTLAAASPTLPEETYEPLMAAIRSLRVIEARVTELASI